MRLLRVLVLMGVMETCLSAGSPPDVSNRPVHIVNQGNVRAGMYWMPTNGGSPMDMGVIEGHDSVTYNSFVGHKFLLRELPDVNRGVCRGEGMECRVGYFTVKSYLRQAVVIEEGFKIRHDVSMNYDTVDDHRERVPTAGSDRDLAMKRQPQPIPISKCQERALQSLTSKSDSSKQALNDLLSCLETNVTSEMQEVSRELHYQRFSRELIGDALENFTCADESHPGSQPVANVTWFHRGITRDINIMLNRDASKIHVLKNFVSEEECQAMEDAARPVLHRASVADGKGGSEISKSRKAMQAGIKVPWHKEAQGNPIAALSRRVYDYTNHVLGLDLKEDGQEDLMSIQYFGRGPNDPEPDRYTPHCDGDCSGMKFKPGTRMATMVMYCTIPDKGGATNFKNAGVHIKPQTGNAVFFSYIGSDKTMDNGFTEHSGCPVIEGEKKIVTQWIRDGVDWENPWDSFNTLGVKLSELDRY